MKRTWLVYVTQGLGHEYHNFLPDCEFYGPYTERQAEAIAAALNQILPTLYPDDVHSGEHPVAKTMAMAPLGRRDLVRKYRQDGVEATRPGGDR